MEHARKRIMRCKHPTPCELCLTDCRRAEITAKEDKIRSDLLTACEEAIDLIKTLEYDGEPVRKNNYKTIETAIAKATG